MNTQESLVKALLVAGLVTHPDDVQIDRPYSKMSHNVDRLTWHEQLYAMVEYFKIESMRHDDAEWMGDTDRMIGAITSYADTSREAQRLCAIKCAEAMSDE